MRCILTSFIATSPHVIVHASFGYAGGASGSGSVSSVSASSARIFAWHWPSGSHQQPSVLPRRSRSAAQKAGPTTSRRRWATDLPYAANQKFVGDYKKKFNETPTFYGAQSYDAINLINSAVVATKGKVSDKAAVGAALKAAKFDSVRGAMKFGNNHFPIHNIYQQEVYKTADGGFDMRTVSTVYKDLVDPYAAKCAMK